MREEAAHLYDLETPAAFDQNAIDVSSEIQDELSTCPAGGSKLSIAGGYRQCLERSPAFRDCFEQRSPFCAHGEPKGTAFDVTAGEDLPTAGKKGSTDTEV